MNNLKKFFLSALCFCTLFIAANAQAKAFIVAADATWPPFEMVDENKQVTGYAIDYIKAVAKEGGFDVVIKNTAWDGIFASLGSRQSDIIASSVTITPERQKVMAFSTPYFRNFQALVVKKGANIKTFADLDDKTVGGQIGTTGMLFLPKLNEDAIAKTYDEVGLAIEDLKNGRIDAVVCDELVAYFYAEKNPEYTEMLTIVDTSTEAEDYGFAMRKADRDLVVKVNAGIKAVKEKGIEEALTKKWLK